MTITTDVIIIGAGPVGLFAIFEAGMMGLKTHVIDSIDFIGGQCSALYPEKPIYDIPGHPVITGLELIENLEKQAAPFAPQFHLGQTVNSLVKNGEYWEILTSKNISLKAKIIIIAAGCGAFGPNKPPLNDIEQYENKSIFYAVTKKETMRDKRIVIAGGGDSAVDWAISLEPIAEKIYFVHRRDKLRCAPTSQNQLMQLANDNNKIEIIIPYQLDRLEGSDGVLREVYVKTLQGEDKILKADILLPFFGLSMDLGPIAKWGLNIDKHHINVDPSNFMTNLPGVFAIGDIAHYKNKLKLILNGFAEASMACKEARDIIHPGVEFHFEYSTTRGMPGK